MGLRDLIVRKLYSIKNIKKRVNDVNSLYAFCETYKDINGEIDSLPEYIQHIYKVTCFLAESMNNSIINFFFSDYHIYKDDLLESLKYCKMDELIPLYNDIYNSLGKMEIDYDMPLNDFKNSLTAMQKRSLEIYDEDLAKIDGYDHHLYESLNKFLLSKLE